MSTLNHDPVTLPGGSYDAAKLQKGLDAATQLPEGERADGIAKAIDAACVRPDAGIEAPGDTRTATVTREIAPGITVTETMQVYHPLPETPEPETAPVAAEADAPVARKKG